MWVRFPPPALVRFPEGQADWGRQPPAKRSSGNALQVQLLSLPLSDVRVMCPWPSGRGASQPSWVGGFNSRRALLRFRGPARSGRLPVTEKNTGSNPVGSATPVEQRSARRSDKAEDVGSSPTGSTDWPRGPTAKTPGSHPGDGGSIPSEATFLQARRCAAGPHKASSPVRAWGLQLLLTLAPDGRAAACKAAQRGFDSHRRLCQEEKPRWRVGL